MLAMLNACHFTKTGSTAVFKFHWLYVLDPKPLQSLYTKRFNHYTTLGIQPNATNEEIQVAYLKLSQKYQPDLIQGYDRCSVSKFLKVQAAYNILSNEQLKREYDFTQFKKQPAKQKLHKSNKHMNFRNIRTDFNIKRFISDILPRPVHKCLYFIYCWRTKSYATAGVSIFLVFILYYLLILCKKHEE